MAAFDNGNYCAGSSYLKRAKLQGPAAYARLSLNPSDKSKTAGSLPSMITAAQPPSFCPELHAKQDSNIVLNCQSVRALAMQVQYALAGHATVV